MINNQERINPALRTVYISIFEIKINISPVERIRDYSMWEIKYVDLAPADFSWRLHYLV